MPEPLQGLHHITLIGTDPVRNRDFYVRELGLRMVKKTVNFDDPGSYHLYYGDEAGTPGTLVTYFAWPGAPPGMPGVGSISSFALRAPLGHAEADPDRFPIRVSHGGTSLEGVTLTVPDGAATGRFLTDLLGFEAQAGGGYGLGSAFAEVIENPDGVPVRIGPGCAHHVAWRVRDDRQQQAWRDRILAAGVPVTPVKDRKYFRSIYFYEPGGVLFEIATDGPGFAVDEPPESLGGALVLPEWLEPRRAVIAAGLIPL